MCRDTALAPRLDLSRGRVDGVEAAWSRDDAIDATAASPTRRDGPGAVRNGTKSTRVDGVDAASRLQIPDLLVIFSKAHHFFVLALGILRQSSEGLQLPPLMFGIRDTFISSRRTTCNAIHDVLDLRGPQKELVLVLGLAADEMLRIFLV